MDSIAIPALILGIIATVLCFIYIVPEKKYNHLNKFGKWLHNMVTFKTLVVEKVLQAIYIFFTAYIILLGFFVMIDGDYYNGMETGLAITVFGPIAIRLFYELAMMMILLVKNVIQINRKLKDANASEETPNCTTNTPVATPPVATPVVNRFCPICGTPCSDNSFCTNCGSKIQ